MKSVPMGGSSRGEQRALKVALVSDELTGCCLKRECHVRDITPLNYPFIFHLWKPDLLLVESAWFGWKNAWKYRIASYPDRPDRTNSRLAKMVAYARNLGIPCAFWNKEDGVHYERFKNSAALFDYIFTVDENCIPAYRELTGNRVPVHPLMFAIQPAIHYAKPNGGPMKKSGSFVGSYSRHVHEERRKWQDMIFRTAAPVGLTVFDRNSNRKSQNYRYPEIPGIEVRSAVPHADTADIYRDYSFSLNVNTVVDSPTMFSRRLIEILGCGGVAVTNPAESVEKHFKGFCHVISNEPEAEDLFSRLKRGISKQDREMALAAAEFVRVHHTWEHRLGDIRRVIGLA
jgi:hypothetical protein